MTAHYPQRKRRLLTRDRAITAIVWLAILSVAALLMLLCVLSLGCATAQDDRQHKIRRPPMAMPVTMTATCSTPSTHSTSDMR